MSTKKFLIGVLIIVGVIAVALLLDYIASKSKNPNQPSPATLSGEVYYLERIALLPGSVIDVSLQDTSLADAPATTLASTTIVTQGENVPIPFTLTYDKNEVKANHTYTISAKITTDGRLAWINHDSIPVLTNGAPMDNIEVLVKSAASSLATNNVNLLGSTFKLVELNGENIPDDSKMTVTFEENNLQAKFCNNMFGSYTLENDTLKAQLASTLMLCQSPEYIMKSETAFSKLVSDGAKLEQDGHKLTLSNTTDKMVFQVFMD